MKKWILIIVGIILVGIVGIGIKINSDFNDLAETFNSEHILDEPSLNILFESISPNEKYKYYQYQFDNGGFGYSRVFWSVIENNKNINDLEKGIIPNGYKIVQWNNESELILEKWKPYYETNTNYELKNNSEFNGIIINIAE
ncbi:MULTISPECIES: hypothetical protein [Nonlabens]|uniref:Uncharacterized protein n=1 Tax=Nonlabens xylanidelens TaxID=191564 RepID=A0A2S6IL47_9FLAO|nr:hypothetical protein [Nonlabens xylanidelens]PPK94928.1 hypothetical protein LY01_01681 [Nonlabens xylanidelens]PQJ17476.1 hypothetical protein BST94_10475 [Nonlabens xylanidelens]